MQLKALFLGTYIVYKGPPLCNCPHTAHITSSNMPSDHLSNGPRPPFHQEIEILAVAVTSWHLIWAATVALSVSWLGLVAYRVYFHPLAKFPGPRLAAATSWYEFYYDVVKDGMMCYQLPKLHARYGIIYLNPVSVFLC